MAYQHIPVMLNEVKEALQLTAGSQVIDCTLGGGGYTLAFAQAIGKTGRVLSIDLDDLALANARRLIKDSGLDNIVLLQGNFGDLAELTADYVGAGQVDGIAMDLGLSSAQLDDEARGFSFQRGGPLDMAFGSESAASTKAIVNRWPEERLASIIKLYGEEPMAKRIAAAIVKARRQGVIENVASLVAIIESALPAAYRRQQKIHFATRTFQALRIATNDELGVLERALPQALELLKVGGRLVVVSFHSLEDRIVKNFFRREAKDCLCPPRQPLCTCGHQARLRLVTKKAQTATEAEVASNPRARSAKLRVAEKIS